MFRHLLSSASVALLALAFAEPASAQLAGTGGSSGLPNSSTAGDLTARALRVGGEDVKLGVIPVGINECDSNANVDFELDGVPDGKSIDVYLGEGCNQVNSRDDDGTGDCDYIGNFDSELTRQQPVVITTRALMGDECSQNMESMPKIWFLAVSTPGGNEDVGKLYTMLDNLRLDTRAPAAPTGVQGGSGEKRIPVEWDASGSDLESFIVLIDPRPTAGGGAGGSGGTSGGDDEDGGVDNEPATGGGSAASGECGSSVLTPRGSIDGLPSSIKRKTINEATATGVDLSPNDIDGEIAAIAVVAVDEAGNASVMSELACVKIVPTDGFWDRYQREGDAVAGGCPCAALGPAHLDSAWPVGLALVLIARSARRRRRS